MQINVNNLENTVNILCKYFTNNNIQEIANVEFPTSIKYKSKEWLYYIFYSCLLDYGMRSKLYHSNLINTYDKYPKLFEPQYVIENLDEDKLKNILKDNIHPRYPNVATKKWITLSIELSKYDNLLNKIKSFETFEELNKFIKNINGYGQKTGGLLLRLIYESKICNFKDEISTIPLDRHDIEISYLNNIIDEKKLNEKQISELSDNYIECCKKLNIEPNLLDKYLWETGNKFCNKKDCLSCPLINNCKTKM